MILLHTRDGNKVFSREEIIENARHQAREGVKPMFSRRDGSMEGRAGFLVWSTYEDGAGVVTLEPDGSGIIWTGWQGDFVIA